MLRRAATGWPSGWLRKTLPGELDTDRLCVSRSYRSYAFGAVGLGFDSKALGHKVLPLGQGGQATFFESLQIDEMTVRVEAVEQ